jgi:serine/threonine protein kinase
VKRKVGLGTFGKVLKCLDKKYNEDVAIKVCDIRLIF